VPLICAPGDVAICNRQAVHGSFANTSPNPRVTFNFGFHRRSSVLGVNGNGIHSEEAIYDDARIAERSKVIGYAISARKTRFPQETPYDYLPQAGQRFDWNDDARADISDYNLLDLGI
jgi:ectoine hydroxylase-related dioxygenase (phytanoyl-CoA dioxygenase family)